MTFSTFDLRLLIARGEKYILPCRPAERILEIASSLGYASNKPSPCSNSVWGTGLRAERPVSPMGQLGVY
jgi:hypothetical protein